MTNICYFCLKSSKACTFVDENVKKIITFIFINELVVDNGFPICEECTQKLQLAFNLKAAIISNEEFILSYETSKPTHEKLLDIFLQKNEIKNAIFSRKLKICRICITVVPNNNFYLWKDVEVDTNVREILTHLPDIDLTVTNNPIVCFKCLGKLEDYRIFINSWLDIYNLKTNYFHFNNKSDISNLTEVRKIFEKNIGPQNSGNYKNGTAMKKEILFRKELENGQEQNVYNSDCIIDNIEVKVDIEEQDLKYPVEAVQVKTESISTTVLLRNDVISTSDDLEIAESQQNTETWQFELKRELDDDIKEKEISIDDAIADSNAFEAFSGSNSVHKLLSNDIQEINQLKLNECSSNQELFTKTSNSRTLVSSSRTDSLPSIDPKDLSLTMKFEYCDSQTKYKVKFKNHSTLHFDECNIFKCEHCNFRTKYKQSLNYHSMVHSDNCKLYKCDLCEFKTKHKFYLKRHLVVHSQKSTLHKCQICDFKSKHKSNLTSHLKLHSENCNLYKCAHCDYKSKHRGNLKNHMTVHSDESNLFKCEHCNFKTKYKHYLKRHFKLHFNNCDLYRCDFCEFKTKYKYYLKRHLIMHSQKSTVHKCQICDFKTKYENNLKSHLIVHSETCNIYKCEHCDFKTKHKVSLKKHTTFHSDECTIFKCEHCDFKTKYKYYLKRHLIVHSQKSTLHKCQICDFKTKYENNLKSHLIVHSETCNIYKCEHCDYKTKHKQCLKRHLIVHSVECKPYRCEHCDFKTKYKRYLKTHLIMHSDECNLIITP